MLSTIQSLPPRTPGRKVLVVLSDFGDNSSHQNLDKTILDLQFAGTTVFALIELARGHESERASKLGLRVAREIAEETGGEAYPIESPQEMDAALRRVQLVLKNSYAVRYHATAQSAKDGKVSLKVEVHRAGVHILVTRQRPPATP